MKHYIRTISRIIIGIIFIFSGFVKVVDPLGFAYKLTDYFNAFEMGYFTSLSLILSMLVSSAEMIIGVCLLLRVKIQWGIWGSFLFMFVFTPLTLYLAIADPVHDCGCFGDALILTNWQTFYKNIFIHVFVLIIFLERKKYNPLLCCKAELFTTLGIFSIAILFSIYCYYHLPIMDFRPYKIGTYLPEQMIMPEGAPTDEYDIVLYYKKNGKVKEFTLEKIPDSTWTWIKTENILVKKGYEPPIHDFSISSLDGVDITDIVLEDKSYTFILSAYDVLESSVKNQEEINQIADYCKRKRIRFIGLTSSLENDITTFKEKNNINYSFYITDEIPLKTIVRSNPGLVLIKNGTVLAKWHYNDIPDIQTLENNYITEEPSGDCLYCD